MNILELQLKIEDDGLGYTLENGLIDVDSVEDSQLADMLNDAYNLLDEIKEYIENKIEEMKDYDDDECYMCD